MCVAPWNLIFNIYDADTINTFRLMQAHLNWYMVCKNTYTFGNFHLQNKIP